MADDRCDSDNTFHLPAIWQMTGVIVIVVFWCSGSVLVSINEVNLRQARLVLRWVTASVWVQFPVRNMYLGM